MRQGPPRSPRAPTAVALSFTTIVLAFFLHDPRSLPAQSREEKVRGDREKIEGAGFWIYNDVPRGLAEARERDKPLVVVLRCLPCEECVKLDDEVVDADPKLHSLLEKFVRVRQVSTNGLDLALFQFDTDQSFAVFLLNGDGTIYGRFGTRSHRTIWANDVSVEGFARALEGALALHARFSKVRDSLAAKRGPAPAAPRPEDLPALGGKYASKLDYAGNVVKSCIHCHQIGDALRKAFIERHERLPEELLFPYPHPGTLGLVLDPKERATVVRVEEGSIAAKSGLRAGDVIDRLGGQPLLSIADAQWVLHGASPAGAELEAVVLREGKEVSLKVALPAGWRRRGDLSWRASSWELRRVATGGMLLRELSGPEQAKAQIAQGSMGLAVEHVGQYSPHDRAKQAGLQKGDVIVEVDGRADLLRETDVLAHVLLEGQLPRLLRVAALRDGKRVEASFQVGQ